MSLYQTSVSSVAEVMAGVTGLSIGNFTHPDLPNMWHWGFSGSFQFRPGTASSVKGSRADVAFRFVVSGVCLGTDRTKQQDASISACYYSYPPVFTADEIFHKVLHPDSDPHAQLVIDNWREFYKQPNQVYHVPQPSNSTLSNSTLPSWSDTVLKLSSERNAFVHASRSAAALAILSLLVAFGNLGFTIGGNENRDWPVRKWNLLIMLVDFLLCVGALALTQVMTNASEFSAKGIVGGGSGNILLIFAILFKVATVPYIGPLMGIAVIAFIMLFLAILDCVASS